MSLQLRPIYPVIAAAVVAWTIAHAAAQPKEPPKELPPFTTAFPDIRSPVRAKGEDRPLTESEKLLAKLLAKYPRPIPDDAIPLVKVRTAQVNEGFAYLELTRRRFDGGLQFDENEYMSYLWITGEFYRVAAELESTAAGKIALYEGRVAACKENERFMEAKVKAGGARPAALHFIRFDRLQAEADLILLKEQLEKASKK